MQEIKDLKKNSEFDSEEDFWDSLLDRTDEENIVELLKEARTCQESEAYRASIVMLWSATIEKIKIMCLYFSSSQLKDVRHLSSEIEINSPKRLEIEDKKILDIAEDLGLIRGNEGVILQSIRTYVRNKCAHGASLDLEHEDINFIQKKVLDYVFSKTDRAGITPQKIIELVKDSKVPDDMLGSVGKFSEQEQYELGNKLYELRKDLPLTRMNRRENYLRREGYYSITDSHRRDAAKDAFKIFWNELKPGVRNQIFNRALKDMMETEGSIGFLLEIAIDEASKEQCEKILQEFLEEKSPVNHEHGNDVAINLAICADNLPEELSNEILETVYEFSLTSTNYDLEKTIEFFESFFTNISQRNRRKLVEIFDEKIYDSEQRWKDEIEKDWVQSRFLNSSEFRFLRRYFSNFNFNQQEILIDILSDSIFYKIEDVEKKVDTFRSERL